MKALTDLEWVALARSKDAARPVLGGIHVNGQMEATDGHRLHWAPAPEGREPGLYDLGWQKLDIGTFPNTGNVIPANPDFRYSFADCREVLALCAARIAYARAMGASDGTSIYTLELNGPDIRTAVDARYLQDILRGYVMGRSHWAVYMFAQQKALAPLYFRGNGGLGLREALLMPVRIEFGAPGGRWELAITSEAR